MSSYNNGDWTPLGKLFVQNVSLYQSIKLPLLNDECLFACCAFGGLVAVGVPRDSLKKNWNVLILTSNGRQMASIDVSELSYLFWSKDQKLIVMNPEGRVILYNSLGQILQAFEMGDVHFARRAKCFAYDDQTGLIVANPSNVVFGVNSINNRAFWFISGLDTQIVITCWAAISSLVKPTTVMICAQTKFYGGIMHGKFEPYSCDWAFKEGRYTCMESNYHNTLVALAHDSNYVQIVTATFDACIHVLKFGASSPLLWCGKNLLFAKRAANELEFCEISFNAIHTFEFQHPVYVGVDRDGIRVFTQDSCNFLGAVPESIANTLSLTASGPSALLLEASRKMDSPDNERCDAFKYVKMVDFHMKDAVEECLKAAVNHFQPFQQKALLKAAYLGMVLCEYCDYSNFVEIVRKLRVLNELRRFGLPLTCSQLDELTIVRVLNRLISLQEWPLAIELAKFMEISDDEGVYMVLAHWCNWIMSAMKCRCEEDGGRVTTTAEKSLAQKLLNRLSLYPRVNYADIALMAVQKGLRVLAYLLLERETDLASQINVLFKLKDNMKALEKAIQSQQPDLLHLVLNHIRKSGELLTGQFELLLMKNPQAYELYQNHMHDSAPSRALDLYKQNDDYARQAIYYLELAESMAADFDASKLTMQLRTAGDALRRDPLASQLVDQAIQQIDENVRLEEKFSSIMTDKSVRETFIFAVSKDEMALAESLKKLHKLSDKQYWLWTIQGFAMGGRWPQLEQFARSKKSPMGYLPLIDVCCRYGNKNLALRFWDKISSYDDQIKAKFLMDDVLGAARMAIASSDMATLQSLRQKQPSNSALWRNITQMIKSLEEAGT